MSLLSLQSAALYWRCWQQAKVIAVQDLQPANLAPWQHARSLRMQSLIRLMQEWRPTVMVLTALIAVHQQRRSGQTSDQGKFMQQPSQQGISSAQTGRQLEAGLALRQSSRSPGGSSLSGRCTQSCARPLPSVSPAAASLIERTLISRVTSQQQSTFQLSEEWLLTSAAPALRPQQVGVQAPSWAGAALGQLSFMRVCRQRNLSCPGNSVRSLEHQGPCLHARDSLQRHWLMLTAHRKWFHIAWHSTYSAMQSRR